VELLRPSSLEEIPAGNSLLLAGGTEMVPLLRDGILETETLVDIRGIVPRGVKGARIGAGTTLAELEAEQSIPEALREACRLAASPQLRNMSSVGGNLLQSTRCWYWRLKYPAHPSDVAAALLALDARLHTTRRELPIADLYRLPDEANRAVTTLEPGEVILELELPTVEASVYLKAMDRQRWAFPQVGVAAARVAGQVRFGLAGVAPVPWLLTGPEALDAATPLPRTAWKVDLARALVRRALDRL